MKPEIEYRPGIGLVDKKVLKVLQAVFTDKGSAPATKAVTAPVTRVTSSVTAEAVEKFELVRAETCPTCGHEAVRPALGSAQKQAAYRARKKVGA